MASKKGNDLKKTPSVTKTFEASFRIEPLSHKIVGKPGEVIPFEFSIESANIASNVEIVPIGLRQELTGLILHDEGAPQSNWVKLTSPSKMRLEPNSPTKIKGLVEIPRGDAKFYSIGVLVKDIGLGSSQESNNRNAAPANDNTVTASIKFITQYVLRLDVEVSGARGEHANLLAIEKVEIIPFQGRPKLVVVLSNPSNTTFELRLQTKVKTSPSDRTAQSIGLAMPVRESLETEDRFVGRILPKSRIQMGELMPYAIGTGSYETEVEILVDGRVVSKQSRPLIVDAADYPAQAVLIAQLGDDIQISPAQIELSQLRGGSRRTSVLIKNTGKDTKSIELEGLDAEGLPLTAAIIQPVTLILPPGGNRKIAITLKTQEDFGLPCLFGSLKIRSQSDRKNVHESLTLPIAISLKKVPLPELTLSPIAWVNSGNKQQFVCDLSNKGETHIAVNARLLLANENGSQVQILAGFGKWLLPGQTTKIEFNGDTNFTPGKYLVKCEVINGERPLITEQTFEFSE